MACYSPVACVVGGSYTDANSNTQGFLDTWTGAQGYWLDATDGGIFTYPNNTFYGSTGCHKLNKPMVGMAATPDGQGYWLVAADGGIFSLRRRPVPRLTRRPSAQQARSSGMATTPDGKGYWLVASDGGIFSLRRRPLLRLAGRPAAQQAHRGHGGHARRRGLLARRLRRGHLQLRRRPVLRLDRQLRLNKPVVGMGQTPDGLGYWLVASDGGIFNYGDANFYGSTGSIVLNKPVVGMAASPSGLGYWLVASDGGVFNYGDAPFEGSAGSLHLNAPVVGMAGLARRRDRRVGPAGPARRPDQDPAGADTPRRYPAPDGRPSGRSRGPRAQSA